MGLLPNAAQEAHAIRLLRNYLSLQGWASNLTLMTYRGTGSGYPTPLGRPTWRVRQALDGSKKLFAKGYFLAAKSKLAALGWAPSYPITDYEVEFRNAANFDPRQGLPLSMQEMREGVEIDWDEFISRDESIDEIDDGRIINYGYDEEGRYVDLDAQSGAGGTSSQPPPTTRTIGSGLTTPPPAEPPSASSGSGGLASLIRGLIGRREEPSPPPKLLNIAPPTQPSQPQMLKLKRPNFNVGRFLRPEFQEGAENQPPAPATTTPTPTPPPPPLRFKLKPQTEAPQTEAPQAQEPQAQAPQAPKLQIPQPQEQTMDKKLRLRDITPFLRIRKIGKVQTVNPPMGEPVMTMGSGPLGQMVDLVSHLGARASRRLQRDFSPGGPNPEHFRECFTEVLSATVEVDASGGAKPSLKPVLDRLFGAGIKRSLFDMNGDREGRYDGAVFRGLYLEPVCSIVPKKATTAAELIGCASLERALLNRVLLVGLGGQYSKSTQSWFMMPVPLHRFTHIQPDGSYASVGGILPSDDTSMRFYPPTSQVANWVVNIDENADEPQPPVDEVTIPAGLDVTIYVDLTFHLEFTESYGLNQD